MKKFILIVLSFLAIVLYNGNVVYGGGKSVLSDHGITTRPIDAVSKEFYERVILLDIKANIPKTLPSTTDTITQELTFDECFRHEFFQEREIYGVHIEYKVTVVSKEFNNNQKHYYIMGQMILFEVKDGKIVQVFPFEAFLIEQYTVTEM